MNEEQNTEQDESQTLEDPPVTPAAVSEGLRAIDQIPRRKWSRLAWLLATEHTREGEAFCITNVTDLTPKADLKSFMQRNWESPLSPSLKGKPGLQYWHREAAIELLRQEGFQPGGVKWYEKWRLRFGLKPKRPCYPPKEKA
jgi:hypothetical protein